MMDVTYLSRSKQDMAISRETINYVAHLSRIELTPEELEKFSGQLGHILGFIDKLNEIDISSIPPTSHILPVSNVLRQDTPRESLPLEKALADAPQRHDGSFGVPKVID